MNNIALYDDLNLQHERTDDISTTPVLEIELSGQWVLVDSELFGSWTGFRRLNGSDHHGPVNYIEGGLYRGSRSCSCPLCQEHVEPKFKKN